MFKHTHSKKRRKKKEEEKEENIKAEISQAEQFVLAAGEAREAIF